MTENILMDWTEGLCAVRGLSETPNLQYILYLLQLTLCSIIFIIM
jgi:hypothetical protein